MTLLRRTWRLLDDVQRRPIAQVVLTILALLLVGATFGRAYVAAMDARGKFDQVVEVLREVLREVAQRQPLILNPRALRERESTRQRLRSQVPSGWKVSITF